ncbi:MAG: DASH family cryptochrome [Methylomicrobium sp.]|nr:DASH family cryptochrome [Methylomicrobium sp.]
MQQLHWFRYDLRLHDQQALLTSDYSKTLTCVFIIDEQWFQPTLWQTKPLGPFRQVFLQQAVSELSDSLQRIGQRLLIKYGNPQTIIKELVEQLGITRISIQKHPGSFERRQIIQLKAALNVEWFESESFTLFAEQQLPFPLSDLPCSYTPFKKQMELVCPNAPYSAVSKLPKFPKQLNTLADDDWPTVPTQQHPFQLPFMGGERAGLKQLDYYFDQNRLNNYKQTRNGFDGWDFSSKLSPWLALGCLSPRRVFSQLKIFEAQKGANESTEWFYLELLWREYFQWLAYRFDTRMYHRRGVRDVNPLLSFYSEYYTAWINGRTGCAIVDAAMKQLKYTGWLSNRSRQIAASFLVNEYQVDWRFGAAWFEQQLIDYDAASNWGNWQYLAGVGTDPRGKRTFNMTKQAQTYDPENEFVSRWNAE